MSFQAGRQTRCLGSSENSARLCPGRGEEYTKCTYPASDQSTVGNWGGKADKLRWSVYPLDRIQVKGFLRCNRPRSARFGGEGRHLSRLMRSADRLKGFRPSILACRTSCHTVVTHRQNRACVWSGIVRWCPAGSQVGAEGLDWLAQASLLHPHTPSSHHPSRESPT